MKKSEVVNKKKMYGQNFTVIWQELQQYCWEFVITKDTYYTIQERSWEAQAYKEKIINWVGKNWMYLEKDWSVYDNPEELNKINNIFKDNTWQSFKDKYYTSNFCSWDIYIYPKTNALWEITSQVIDSRTIRKNVDKYWNITWYTQVVWQAMKQIPVDWLYNSITRFDPNNPSYWKSLYKSIVYDSLSDKESSQRQFYFFKNNAVPNAVFMLDPKVTDPEIIKSIKDDLKNKYGWSANAHKSIVSSWITDVKLLELSNKDLDLLNLRKFVIQKMGILFQIDPRLIWFMQDSWADRSIWSIRKEAGETIYNLSRILEEDTNNFYKMFINPNADFVIKLDNESFEDRNVIEENQRKDVSLWLLTINEIRKERWLDEYADDQANKPILWSNLTFLETLWTVNNL